MDLREGEIVGEGGTEVDIQYVREEYIKRKVNFLRVKKNIFFRVTNMLLVYGVDRAH